MMGKRSLATISNEQQRVAEQQREADERAHYVGRVKEQLDTEQGENDERICEQLFIAVIAATWANREISTRGLRGQKAMEYALEEGHEAVRLYREVR